MLKLSRAGTAELSDAVDQLGHVCLVSTEVKCFSRSPDSEGPLYHLVPYWLEIPVRWQLRSSSPPEVGMETSAEGSCVLPAISCGFRGCPCEKPSLAVFSTYVKKY